MSRVESSPSKLGPKSSTGGLLEHGGIEIAGSSRNAVDDKSGFCRHDALCNGVDGMEQHQFADTGNGRSHEALLCVEIK